MVFWLSPIAVISHRTSDSARPEDHFVTASHLNGSRATPAPYDAAECFLRVTSRSSMMKFSPRQEMDPLRRRGAPLGRHGRGNPAPIPPSAHRPDPAPARRSPGGRSWRASTGSRPVPQARHLTGGRDLPPAFSQFSATVSVGARRCGAQRPVRWDEPLPTRRLTIAAARPSGHPRIRGNVHARGGLRPDKFQGFRIALSRTGVRWRR